MRAFLAVAPDGRQHRLVFPSEHEAEANAEAMRKAGTAVIPLHWSRTLQRYVTVPKDDVDA
jgi:hypothetical protein